MFEYLEQNLNLNFRAKREEKFCLNTWSQTRIRPGFEAESHEQEQSQEPDAHQASIQSPEPRARAKPRARRASGQAPRPEARSNALSQTRCRPRTEARGQDVRPEPGTFQASIRGTSLATMPKCLTRSGGGGRAERERARACACVRVRARARTPIKSNT